MTYLEAIVIGGIQGVTELFPVSSLGHSVLIPALVGGQWAADLNVSAPASPYLAYIVGLHVATALALLGFFWRDWVEIITGFITSVKHRRVQTRGERLAWMIILGTIPVGIFGLALEHTFRTTLGRPIPAAVFLMINGGILYAAERLRRRSPAAAPGTAGLLTRTGESATYASASARSAGASYVSLPNDPAHAGADGHSSDADASDTRIAAQSMRTTTIIGAAQTLALLPGISRSGSTIAAGLLKGLSHEDAARFAFLLAAPVIAAAGVLKLPTLAGPAGHGILGPVLVGSLVAGGAAYVSLRFLTRYFETRTLNPFAVYCVIAGFVALVWVSLAS
jgi:undecaprenyl-diphosphatase